MFETEKCTHQVISEEVMLGRLAQSEQMREFFIQMWIQNPALAKQGGVKIQSLLSQLQPVAAIPIEKGTGDVR